MIYKFDTTVTRVAAVSETEQKKRSMNKLQEQTQIKTRTSQDSVDLQ